MPIEKIKPFKNAPKKMTALIEVPENGQVKYEIDKDTGLMKVDRILHSPMAYPANYGYFPNTLGDDGDPLDCVVICNAPLRPGVIIDVRPIGVLVMKDQAGGDEKIICVPTGKVDPYYEKISRIEELPFSLRSRIEYFFKHYKDLEPNAWSQIIGWDDRARAEKIILDAIARAGNAGKKSKNKRI